MKRTRSSDSLIGADLYEEEEPLFSGEKKRRLNLQQVRALEKSFEMENKLDPERKVRIALDTGLQPRQVAVWFQNRRARWKTKQLERDFSALRNSYDSLTINCESLRRDKEILQAEIKELRAKLGMKEEGFGCKAGKGKDGSSDSDSSAVVYDEKLPLEIRCRPNGLEELQSLMVQRSFLPKEEHNVFSGEENSSDFFANEQNPGFSWYCSENWVLS